MPHNAAPDALGALLLQFRLCATRAETRMPRRCQHVDLTKRGAPRHHRIDFEASWERGGPLWQRPGLAESFETAAVVDWPRPPVGRSSIAAWPASGPLWSELWPKSPDLRGPENEPGDGPIPMQLRVAQDMPLSS